ncbi:MAG: pyridoxamine 5'-phosphate oxidase [Myxococcaceae bacterium]|nr:pyridoxamine 5'-phosphate oxidase [Myxococcaceae bacterium]
MFSTNPIEQFKSWFHEAEQAGVLVPEGMTLATVDEDGIPDARVVLLKEVREESFVFFTNYLSSKGRQIHVHSQAALVFWWASMEKQIRVRGSLFKIEPAQSDAYFKTRPRGSQLSVWASHQSEILLERSILEKSVQSYARRFEGKEVPRPPHWGGYALKPNSLEFWQGQESRLHDRFRYCRNSAGSWAVNRLFP